MNVECTTTPFIFVYCAKHAGAWNNQVAAHLRQCLSLTTQSASAQIIKQEIISSRCRVLRQHEGKKKLLPKVVCIQIDLSAFYLRRTRTSYTTGSSNNSLILIKTFAHFVVAPVSPFPTVPPLLSLSLSRCLTRLTRKCDFRGLILYASLVGPPASYTKSGTRTM